MARNAENVSIWWRHHVNQHLPHGIQGLYSLGRWMSYDKISWSLEATIFGFSIFHKWPETRKMFPFDDVIMLTNIFLMEYRASIHWADGCLTTRSHEVSKPRYLVLVFSNRFCWWHLINAEVFYLGSRVLLTWCSHSPSAVSWQKGLVMGLLMTCRHGGVSLVVDHVVT